MRAEDRGREKRMADKEEREETERARTLIKIR